MIRLVQSASGTDRLLERFKKVTAESIRATDYFRRSGTLTVKLVQDSIVAATYRRTSFFTARISQALLAGVTPEKRFKRFNTDVTTVTASLRSIYFITKGLHSRR